MCNSDSFVTVVAAFGSGREVHRPCLKSRRVFVTLFHSLYAGGVDPSRRLASQR